ncbi:MAG: ECF-type riboflavin transporter substrate-binding protein [Treponema sp.]|nr:ECF-type riboflavin transporter substrate-binding protein [Treponema sp.]
MKLDSKNMIRTVVTIGIGTAIFVALTLVQIPIFFVPNTALQVRAAVLAFFSAAFGPIAGLAIGIIGHALGDAIFYGSIWWSWVLPDGIFGLIVGLFAKKYAIQEAGFKLPKLVLFNVIQILANVIAWIVVAPVLDIAIYKEPVNKVFTQGAIAALLNVIIILILGSLLSLGYSKRMNASSSLQEDKD